MTKIITVKIKKDLLNLSSYDKAMEDFVATKPNRIIEVVAETRSSKTYYKCPEFDYWVFSEEMFTIATAQEKANANIAHMMNGGTCVYGKYNRKVFQGTNGNFYIEKDEEDRSKGATIFTNLFCKLSVAKYAQN